MSREVRLLQGDSDPRKTMEMAQDLLPATFLLVEAYVMYIRCDAPTRASCVPFLQNILYRYNSQ